MTPQEAIEILKAAKSNYVGEINSALDCAINALENQIPKKIKEVHADEYFCPACWAENNCWQGIVEDKFCPNCGQALDREEEE